jgi:ribosomal protein S18 acetylase RimI-like enzyme
VKANRSSPIIRSITDDDGWLPAQIAKLQDRRQGMSWRVSDIRDMLCSGAMKGFARISYRRGALRRLDGYILFRTMADEGEILSLVVRPQSRRRGLARDFLTHALMCMEESHVKRAFLEVSAANRAAIALYKKLGFKVIAIRRGYYSTIKGETRDAFVLAVTVPTSRNRRIHGAFPD